MYLDLLWAKREQLRDGIEKCKPHEVEHIRGQAYVLSNLLDELEKHEQWKKTDK